MVDLEENDNDNVAGKKIKVKVSCSGSCICSTGSIAFDNKNSSIAFCIKKVRKLNPILKLNPMLNLRKEQFQLEVMLT